VGVSVGRRQRGVRRAFVSRVDQSADVRLTRGRQRWEELVLVARRSFKGSL